MRRKIAIGISVFCLFVSPLTLYGATQNSVPYVSQGEKGKVYSAQLKINNLYGEVQAGEYFTLNLIGGEFDEDENGSSRVYSYYAEFDKNTKTSVTGRFSDQVTGAEDIGISFYSKILADEAMIEINAENSHLTPGTYTYAINKDSDISHKSTITIDRPKAFYETIDLEAITIEERYSGAFRSLQSYEYDADELIKIELPKGDYEFYNREYLHPISLIVEDGTGKETKYQLDRDIELKLSPDRSTLIFRQYNEEILQASGKPYKIRIENLRIKAANPAQEKDVYVNTGGSWVKDEKVLIGQEVKDQLTIETSKIPAGAIKKEKVSFTMQEANQGTLFSEGDLAFGLSDGIPINFQENFKLKLIDGSKTYTIDKNNLKVEQDGNLFIIKNYERQKPHNLIRIEGEFMATIPETIDKDIKFFVSAPEITQVFYSTLLEVEKEEAEGPSEPDKKDMPVVEFKVASKYYILDSQKHPIDASPYISSANRIMVPFRYVAYTLGADPSHLKWDGMGQKITLEGDKALVIDIGTKEMKKDHVINTLSEIEIKQGRTFVPVGEIAKILGIQVKWDPTSQTATFN